jgi:hypothetical protein
VTALFSHIFQAINDPTGDSVRMSKKPERRKNQLLDGLD